MGVLVSKDGSFLKVLREIKDEGERDESEVKIKEGIALRMNKVGRSREGWDPQQQREVDGGVSLYSI